MGASKLGMASSRVMGTCAIGGQAIGTAAALCLKGDGDIRHVDVEALQQTLLRDDCYLPLHENTDPLTWPVAVKSRRPPSRRITPQRTSSPALPVSRGGPQRVAVRWPVRERRVGPAGPAEDWQNSPGAGDLRLQFRFGEEDHSCPPAASSSRRSAFPRSW